MPDNSRNVEHLRLSVSEGGIANGYHPRDAPFKQPVEICKVGETTPKRTVSRTTPRTVSVVATLLYIASSRDRVVLGMDGELGCVLPGLPGRGDYWIGWAATIRGDWEVFGALTALYLHARSVFVIQLCNYGKKPRSPGASVLKHRRNPNRNTSSRDAPVEDWLPAWSVLAKKPG